MKHSARYTEVRRSLSAIMLTLALSLNLFAQAPALVREAPALAPAEVELTQKITVESIKEMTAALAAPEMEGRGTGQPGGDKAANWIAERFRTMGLKPLGDKGTYLQKLEFKETTATAETSFTAGETTLKHGVDFALMPQNNGNKNVSGDMVFLAYAIQSKGSGIDQIASTNLQGKVAVIMDGPPPGVD